MKDGRNVDVLFALVAVLLTKTVTNLYGTFYQTLSDIMLLKVFPSCVVLAFR